MSLYIVKDGIRNVRCITKNGKRIEHTNFYLITYDFKSNEGYIEKREESIWRLYTQVGQELNKKRYFTFETLDECIRKLTILNKGNKVEIYKGQKL